MGRVFKLVDSGGVLSEINLIDETAATGIIAQRGGFGPVRLKDGREFVEETWTLNLKHTSQDNQSAQWINLMDMLAKAEDYFRKPWQISPVFFNDTATTENKSRYATVYGRAQVVAPDLFAQPFESSANLEQVGLKILREPNWRSNKQGTPGTALTLTETDGPTTPKKVVVSNFRDSFSLTHIYNYDSNLAAFSANLIGEAAFAYFEVSGSTPADDDSTYFGSTEGPFHVIVLNIGTAGSANDTVMNLEYWDGDSWEDVSPSSLYPHRLVTVGVLTPGDFMGETGLHIINIGNVPDWAAVEINSVTAYWIRLRIEDEPAQTISWITSPAQATDVVYAQSQPKAILPNTQIDGDAPAIPLVRVENGDGSNTGATAGYDRPSRIFMGMRTHDTGDFFSRVNLANVGTTGQWTASATDSTFTADPDAPGNQHALVDFSSDPNTMATRVTLNQATGKDLGDLRGIFRVFLIAQQLGGADNDCEVQLEYITVANTQTSIYSAERKLETKDAGRELVDIGTIQFPFMEMSQGDTFYEDARILVKAKRASGSAATLELHELVLLPSDEWFGYLDDPVDATNGSTSFEWCRLSLDTGVIAQRCIKENKTTSGYSPSCYWALSSRFPYLEPETEVHFYFLIAHYPAAFGTGPLMCSLGSSLTFELYAHNQYSLLRGAE
jgi:hypothetical protein